MCVIVWPRMLIVVYSISITNVSLVYRMHQKLYIVTNPRYRAPLFFNINHNCTGLGIHVSFLELYGSLNKSEIYCTHNFYGMWNFMPLLGPFFYNVLCGTLYNGHKNLVPKNLLHVSSHLAEFFSTYLLGMWSTPICCIYAWWSLLKYVAHLSDPVPNRGA